MKSLVVEVPEEIAAEVQRLVAGGWFQSENEVARQALIEFVRARSAELQEQFQRDDIAWAVAEAKPRR
jgi:Arc/MetJ-type ribon-helix-helix transcriptional regulator